MPSPFTGGCGRLTVALAGRLRRSGGFAVGLRFRLGAAGFAAGAAGAFLAPGRRAPGAMPRPLTSGSGFAGASGGGFSGCLGLRLLQAPQRRFPRASRLGLGGAAAASWHRVVLAPAAMPRPLTSGSGLAGASRFRRCLGGGLRLCLGRCRGGLLGAGSLGAGCDAEALGGSGAGALSAGAAGAADDVCPAQTAEPSSRRAALHRPRCRGP